MIPIVDKRSGYTDTSDKSQISAVLAHLPDWYLRAARISRVELYSTLRGGGAQKAEYHHGSRKIELVARLPFGLLAEVLSHEIGHGLDDQEGVDWVVPNLQPEETGRHFWSRADQWSVIHRNATRFNHPSHKNSPQEYFAECAGTFARLPTEFRLSYPEEARYLSEVQEHHNNSARR